MASIDLGLGLSFMIQCSIPCDLMPTSCYVGSCQTYHLFWGTLYSLLLIRHLIVGDLFFDKSRVQNKTAMDQGILQGFCQTQRLVQTSRTMWFCALE